MKTFIAIALSLLIGAAVFAADAPRFRGPNGDGKFDEKGLLKSWPEGGPPVAWIAKGLGKGYSSAAVVQGRIYVAGMTDDQTGHVYILDMNGQRIGDIPYGKETVNDAASGARSTPTIDGNRLYILSGLGVVYCLDLDVRTTLWNVNILERFHAANIEWYLSESLLVDGDRVICTPGGKEGGVAALNKMTGETVWAAKGIDDMTAYVSPVIAVHNGRRILLTETAKFVVGVDADTGALLWKHEHITKYDIHACAPIYDKGLVYYSAGYGSGGGALELSPDGSSVTQKWTDSVLDCQHHGVILVDGYLYGGRHRGQFVCLEMATGKLMWKAPEIRQAVTVYADGMLYLYEGPQEGVVSLVKPDPAGFQRTGRFTVTEGTENHWAHPTIANGLLLIRHGDALIAYNVKAN